MSCLQLGQFPASSSENPSPTCFIQHSINSSVECDSIASLHVGHSVKLIQFHDNGIINKLYMIMKFIKMNLSDRFQNSLHCVCGENVIFDVMDIECDWGSHSVIQCPKCEELFSIDVECPAFQNLLELLKNNPTLYTEKEKSEYVTNSHPN
jgi:hypothetical protein